MQIRTHVQASKYWHLGAMVLSLVLAPALSNAAQLNLSSTHFGDVTTHIIDVKYVLNANPSTGTLTAEGTADQFDLNNQNIIDGTFSLNLTVNRATGAPLGGTLVITGDTDGLPHHGPGTLLTANITHFGFRDAPFAPLSAGNLFEFLADVTGGILAAPYYGSQKAGIIMNIQNSNPAPFTGVFTSAFHNDGFSGFSDTFPVENPNVPEPTAFVLMLLAIVPLGWRLQRRLRSHV